MDIKLLKAIIDHDNPVDVVNETMAKMEFEVIVNIKPFWRGASSCELEHAIRESMVKQFSDSSDLEQYAKQRLQQNLVAQLESFNLTISKLRNLRKSHNETNRRFVDINDE